MSNEMFAKFNEMFGGESGLADLKSDIETAASKDVAFVEVPKGDYEVKITKIELGETGEKSKTPGVPKASVWFEIVAGEYKGQKIFMTQVLTKPFSFHKLNEFLNSLETGIPVGFENFVQYGDLLEQIFNEVDGRAEYHLAYGENKGFPTYDIIQKLS